MGIGDASLCESCLELVLAELGIVPRLRNRAYVNELLDVMGLEQFQKFFNGPGGMADGVEGFHISRLLFLEMAYILSRSGINRAIGFGEQRGEILACTGAGTIAQGFENRCI